MTDRLVVESATADGVKVLTVRGEVDMESSPQLLKAIQDGLRQSLAHVVDLAGVRYMDSSGIAVLVQGLRGARKRGLDFRLRQPSKPVMAVLRLAQLNQLFTIEEPGAPKA